MQNNLKTLFLDNLELDEAISAFLAQDPEFVQAEQEFYETAHEIAQLVGFERYDRFDVIPPACLRFIISSVWACVKRFCGLWRIDATPLPSAHGAPGA